jgi:hypothetical protein
MWSLQDAAAAAERGAQRVAPLQPNICLELSCSLREQALLHLLCTRQLYMVTTKIQSQQLCRLPAGEMRLLMDTCWRCAGALTAAERSVSEHSHADQYQLLDSV